MSESPAAVFARLSESRPPADTTVLMDTAILLGGSIAGLMAARVLADHAASVVIIDRDEPETRGQARPGVPQGTQMHALLPGGLVQLERWFPGFTDDAVAAGGKLAPATVRRTYIDGVRKATGSHAQMLTGTRPFLEARIRHHTLALPNVKSLTATITGVDFDGDAVSGVRYESRGAQGVEQADFVVDAMGRASRLSEWLAQAGWERPTMRRMTVDLNYATGLLRRAEHDIEANGVLALHSAGPKSAGVAGAAILQVEGDRWVVMMGGYVDSRPGRTAEDMVRVCRNDFPEEFGEVASRPFLGEPSAYRHPDSRRRDFHAMTRLPARLIAVGDAVASFNPVYGQGMSSATLHASCLSEYLRSAPDLNRPARDFFALQKVIVDAAWDISTFADLALPHVDGPYPRGYRLLRWVNNQVMAATVIDADLCRRFDEVTFMLKHPATLATPGIVLRSVFVNLMARLRR